MKQCRTRRPKPNAALSMCEEEHWQISKAVFVAAKQRSRVMKKPDLDQPNKPPMSRALTCSSCGQAELVALLANAVTRGSGPTYNCDSCI